MANRFFPNYNGYKITSPFGMRTLSGSTRMHTGIDLVAKTNSGASAVDYITAHTGGVVSGVGYDSTSGHYVKIMVSDRAEMVYCHLREASKLKKGAAVKSGDTIGYMGSTGRSTGAHLHWGIKKDGSWIDPAPYLDKEYTDGAEPAAKNVCTVTLPVLRRGDKGESVKAMQRLLIANGYNCGGYGADGDFGAATEKALKSFQKAKGLAVDGICGPATWASLLGV